MPSGIEGKCLCFTGTLEKQTRAEATAAAKEAGATVAKTITKSVDIVVAGPGAGAKLEQAKSKGCDVWTEDEFQAAISEGGEEEGGDGDEEEEEEAAGDDEAKTGTTTIEGKCLCFTGKLEKQTREEATEAAKEAGATVSKTITKSVDIVVAGPGAGAKLEQAKSKGCDVWTEDEFQAAISAGGGGGDGDEEEDETGGDDEAAGSGGGLEGKCLCFTGTLEKQTRDEATAAAKAAGATVAKSVTKAVDIVVAGPGAGAKLQQAKSKGCEIWTEEEFQAAVGGDDGGGDDEKKKSGSKKKKAPPTAAGGTPAKKAKTAPKSTPAAAAAAAKKPPPKIEPATPAIPGTKGRKVMSAIAGGNDTYSVVGEYDVKLMLSDQVSMNSNKFYKLQLLQKKDDSNYYVATNWGRLGEPGKSQLKGPHGDRGKGVAEFSKVFRSKTKNAWGTPFVRYPDKYQLVEVQEEDDEGGDGGGGDGDQALGRLTEAQIHKGQEVLKQIRAKLDDAKLKASTKATDLGYLTNEFYSLIPTKSGRQRPPKLDNGDIVTEKEGLLEFWLRMGFEEVSAQDAEGSPIEGVFDRPVPATLTEAASNISDDHSISSSRSRGEDLSARGAGNPSGGSMGSELYAAILLYTGNSIYRELNRVLRLEWKSAPKYWNYLRLYFAAVECMPRKKVTLWRGIAADLYDDYAPGKVITWWTVSSCTSDKGVAENFMNQLGSGKATLLTLHTQRACDISSLSFYPHEKESLLSPGTKLKVLNRERNGNVAEIEVEEVVVDDDDDGDKKQKAK